MKRAHAGIGSLAGLALALYACSGDDTTGATQTDGGAHDGASPDGGGSPDVSADTTAPDTGGDSSSDGGDAGCPASWTVAPVVDPVLALPDGGGGVLLHASATGTQDYTCTAVSGDAGTTYAWVFAGPEADLADCTAAKIGRHFASDGGPGAPEWMTTADGTYVIGKKVVGETPDGGAGAVPWLLLQATAHGGGTGTLSRVGYIHRVNTTGGVAPTTTCDSGSVGVTQKVAYTADYYFYGQ